MTYHKFFCWTRLKLQDQLYFNKILVIIPKNL